MYGAALVCIPRLSSCAVCAERSIWLSVRDSYVDCQMAHGLAPTCPLTGECKRAQLYGTHYPHVGEEDTKGGSLFGFNRPAENEGAHRIIRGSCRVAQPAPRLRRGRI